MKFLLKLALVALVANAAWRVGTAYFTHYTFRDAVREAALMQSLDDERLHDRILELAADHDVPIDGDSFSIRREERRTMVDGHYTRAILLFPGYEYVWGFEWAIDGYVVVPPNIKAVTPGR